MILALLLVAAFAIGFVALHYDWSGHHKVVRLDSSPGPRVLDSYRIARHVKPASTSLQLPQRQPPRVSVQPRRTLLREELTATTRRYSVLTPLPTLKKGKYA